MHPPSRVTKNLNLDMSNSTKAHGFNWNQWPKWWGDLKPCCIRNRKITKEWLTRRVEAYKRRGVMISILKSLQGCHLCREICIEKDQACSKAIGANIRIGILMIGTVEKCVRDACGRNSYISIKPLFSSRETWLGTYFGHLLSELMVW